MITARDEKVLSGIQKFRFMRTEQIAELWFKYRQGTKEKMSQKELVARRRLRELQKQVRELKYLNDFHNESRVWTMYDERVNSLASLGRIKHYLSVVDVYIDCINSPGEVLMFDVEKQIDEGLRPDIFLLHIYNTEKRLGRAYYIEVDRSTEPLRKIKAKLQKYSKYFDERKYLKEEWNKAQIKPSVVFVCKSLERARNVQKLSKGIITTTDIKTVLNRK